MSARSHRRPLRGRLAVESLEPRRALAVDVTAEFEPIDATLPEDGGGLEEVVVLEPPAEPFVGADPGVDVTTEVVWQDFPEPPTDPDAEEPPEPLSMTTVIRNAEDDGADGAELVAMTTLVAPPATPRIALTDGTRPSARNPLRRRAELEIRGLEPAARVEYSVAGGPWGASWQAVEGQNAVRVRQVDTSSRASEPSAELRFRLDSRVEPVTVALARDTGRSGTDRVTTDPRLVLGRREAGAGVRYSVDGGATWSGRFFPREGRNVVLVRQVDKAGNVSAATRFAFTLDRLRPPPPVVLPGRGRGRTVTIAGQPRGTRLEYSFAGGAWTTDVSTTAGRRGGIRVRFVDRAGNASVPSAEFRGGIRPA